MNIKKVTTLKDIYYTDEYGRRIRWVGVGEKVAIPAGTEIEIIGGPNGKKQWVVRWRDASGPRAGKVYDNILQEATK